MSSDESDNEDIPEASECQNLCEKFAEITGTDTACAQFYLQGRKWSLEQSVNDFFEDRNSKGAVRVNDRQEAEVVVVFDGSSKGLAAAATAVLAESALSRAAGSPRPKETKPSSTLKFITWNIDGLNEKNFKLRTKAVCKNIINEQADIIFLQEVIPEAAEYILKNLADYHCLFGSEAGYFVGTLLRKSTVKYDDFEIIDFPNSRMMRNALSVKAMFQNIPLSLFNSHLESTADGSEERKQQLKSMFKKVHATSEDRTVIFAGDLNLRDKELTELGGLPAGIEDVWVMCGSRKECAYTFDMTRNDNLQWNSRFKPRCRFDRIYMRASSPSKLKPAFFGLIGLERLLPHRCFPSDHWGVLAHFEMEYRSSEGVSACGTVHAESVLSHAIQTPGTKEMKPSTALKLITSNVDGSGKKNIKERKKAVSEYIVDQSSEGFSASGTAVHAESVSFRAIQTPGSKEMKPSTTLKLITWNVDGSDKKNIKERMKAVCDYILDEQADIVFLQEVVLEAAECFADHMVDYVCLFGDKDGYFVGTLLKKSTVKYDEGEVIPFPNSRMRKNVFMVKATFQSIPLCLFNSHLECSKKFSEEKKKQLKYVFKKVLATSEEVTAIFGGDLSLNDVELKELGGLPDGIEDVYITCGSPAGCHYTFDTTTNDNSNCTLVVRKRTDRLYVRASSPPNLKPSFFDLIGSERLEEPCDCFPSDHWGILAHFKIET